MKFSISWIRWYLVDIRDIRKPFLVKKHFLTKEFAIDYRERYYRNKFFEPIIGKEAKDLNWAEGITPMTRKYNYGKGAWYSQREKLVIRVRKRKKLYRMLRKDNPLTEKVVSDILQGKPMLFLHRYKQLRNDFWAFSQPIKSYQWTRGFLVESGEIEMLYPNNFNYISKIIKTLDKYEYDMGFYEKSAVALRIYKRYRRLIIKYTNGSIIDPDIDRITYEFKARGFIPIENVKLAESDNYLKTVNCPEVLILPRTFWHNVNDKNRNLYLYDAHRLYGLPGYCQACPAGLEKRK